MDRTYWDLHLSHVRNMFAHVGREYIHPSLWGSNARQGFHAYLTLVGARHIYPSSRKPSVAPFTVHNINEYPVPGTETLDFDAAS
jgi:hypothetical protein